MDQRGSQHRGNSSKESSYSHLRLSPPHTTLADKGEGRQHAPILYYSAYAMKGYKESMLFLVYSMHSTLLFIQYDTYARTERNKGEKRNRLYKAPHLNISTNQMGWVEKKLVGTSCVSCHCTLLA